MKRQLVLTLLSMTMLTSNAFAAQAVPLVSGGVGQTERAIIDQNEDAYNTKLVYTGEGGMYLSDVSVIIKDAKGNEVVNTVTEGPILLTDLKPGRYSVVSAAEGFTKKQTINTGEKLKTYTIRFPVKDKDNLDAAKTDADAAAEASTASSGTVQNLNDQYHLKLRSSQ